MVTSHFHRLGAPETGPTTLFCDNQSMLKIVRNPIFHEQTKHIEVQRHYIRDHVQQQNIQLQYCSTREQHAEIFTNLLQL